MKNCFSDLPHAIFPIFKQLEMGLGSAFQSVNGHGVSL